MKRLSRTLFHALLLATVSIALAFSMAQPGYAQEAPEPSLPRNLRFAYSVKFVCGPSSESFQEGVVSGAYATAINILNPSLRNRINFVKRIARALPYQTSGEVTQFEHGVLEPNHAIEVECNEIRRRLPLPMTQQFRTGFLVILSSHEMDVTAVYTARPANGEVATIEVETIEPRKLSEDDSAQLPDLTVQAILLDTLRVDCPQGRGSCVTQVDVEIANIGSAAAGAFRTRTTLDPNQSVTVDEQSPGGLAAGESKKFSVTTEPGGNCYDPDCEICVEVDSDNSILESDETNNNLCAQVQG
jgi:hypothetical protein